MVRKRSLAAVEETFELPRKRYVAGRCNCSCHRHPGTKHCIACCNKCPHCGENIILALYDSHVEECAQRKDGYPRRPLMS